MANPAWTSGVDEQYGPLRATRAGCESLVAIDDVTAVDFFDGRAEANRLVRFASLWFTTPRHPLFTTLDDAFEPARLLLRTGHAVEQHEGVDMTFPATREREIHAGYLFRPHPQREDVAGVWTKTVTAVLFRNHRREETLAKQVVEVCGRKRRGAIVFSRARRKLLTRQHADAIDQILLLRLEIELAVDVVPGVGGYHL